MFDKNVLMKLTRVVGRAQRILLASHKNCGDATGSMVACYLAFSHLSKPVDMFLPGAVSANLAFLPATEKIITDSSKINLADYDLFFCVDAAEVAMTGLAEQWQKRPSSLITVNFDHHLTNPGYGDINIVDKTASAACAMVYEWFKLAGYPIDQKMAACLLTGILTDTGSFSNPATDGMALRTAAELLRYGVSVAAVLGSVVYNKTLNELKLWGRALERLSVNTELGIVSTIITNQDLVDLKIDPQAVEGIANFLNDLSGWRAVLVLKEQSDGSIKGSLRTTREDVDVAELAKLFGGGGHRKAAGFTIKGRLVERDNRWVVEV